MNKLTPVSAKILAFSVCFGLTPMAMASSDMNKEESGNTKENSTVIKVDGEFPVNLMQEVSEYEPNEAGHYEIKANSTLKETLQSWVDLVGYELVWQPKAEDGDVEFARTMAFQGTFKEASEDLFGILSQQSKFDAQLHSNGVLRVFVAKDNK